MPLVLIIVVLVPSELMAILNGSHVGKARDAVDAAIDSLHTSLRELNREVSL